MAAVARHLGVVHGGGRQRRGRRQSEAEGSGWPDSEGCGSGMAKSEGVWVGDGQIQQGRRDLAAPAVHPPQLRQGGGTPPPPHYLTPAEHRPPSAAATPWPSYLVFGSWEWEGKERVMRDGNRRETREDNGFVVGPVCTVHLTASFISLTVSHFKN